MKKLRNIIILLLLFPSTGFVQEKGLSLSDCRQKALAYNKKIKMAGEHQGAAESLKKAARTQYFPNFHFNGSYMRMGKVPKLSYDQQLLPVVPFSAIDPETGKFSSQSLQDPEVAQNTVLVNPETGEIIYDGKGNPAFLQYAMLPKGELEIGSHNIFIAGLAMTQPVYMGGKIRELNNIADYGLSIAREQTELKKSEIIYKTDEYYWQVIAVQEKVKLAKEYKAMLDSLVTDLKNILEEGIITRNELLKAKVKQSEAELSLTKAQNGLILSRMALNQAIGFPLDTTFQLSDTLEEKFYLKIEDNIMEQAINNRSELTILKRNIDMAVSASNIMKSRYLPNVALSANYLYLNPNPYNNFKEEFGGDWSIGVTANIPIYHWGDKKYTLDAARHEKRAAELKYQESTEMIRLQVKQTLFSYNESVKKINMTKTALEQATENLKITKNNFEEGILKTTDLLEAQVMWQEAKANYIDAKTEAKLLQTKLKKVSGQLSIEPAD